MTSRNRPNDSIHWFMSELSSRVVAETGIPSDRHHLGKLILQSLKDAPDFVSQIDGATGEADTNSSVLTRSVRCAEAYIKFGLQTGDVIVLMAPSHLDLAIAMYAALYLGVIVAPVDRTMTIKELQGTFDINKPKLIFCQSEKASDVQVALNNLELDTQIVTFDNGDYLLSFAEFVETNELDSLDDFKASDFDPEETIAFLIPTSGTTGLPKSAAGTHKNFAMAACYWWWTFFEFPTPTKLAMIGSPLQWMTALAHFTISPIFRYTRLQSSLPLTRELVYEMVPKYRPTYTVFSPTMMTSLLKPIDGNLLDLTSFEVILLGGSAVPAELIDEINLVSPDTQVWNVYGMTELSGVGFCTGGSPPGSCGKPLGGFEYRLVNIETLEDILQPNEEGELWVKGPAIFKEYYNNPEATDETFAEDRWFRTGDIFYRDEHWNFYFVDRYKLLLKYMSHHISPVEVEAVIRQHPAVLDVAVTGIPDPNCGDLAVAFVVRRPGEDLTAEDVKDIVRENLADSKQLRGGVVFVNEIPMTASTKIHRRKLKEMVLYMDRE